MKKIIVMCLSLLSCNALAADNIDWLTKVYQRLDFGNYAGKTVKSKDCLVSLYPTANPASGYFEILLSIKSFNKNVFGSEKTLASIHLLPTDVLTGSSQYPNGPYESTDVLAVGYKEKSQIFDKAIVIQSMNDDMLAVTIEVQSESGVDSVTCTVDSKQPH